MCGESDTVTEILSDDVIVGNFSSLNSEISHAETEIKLDKDYTYDSATDSSFGNGIEISKDNFVVDGQGHTLNGANQARVFNIVANNVTLKNIKFKSGNVYENGGAAYFDNDGEVINCSFENSVSRSGSTNQDGGGAIFFNQSGIITDSRFYENSGMSGGAVIILGNGNLTNCIFMDNSARYGGGIYIYNNGTLVNCTFSSNDAILGGGAAWIVGCGTVENCSFLDNEVTMQGQSQGAATAGALFLGEYSYVIDCNFEGNKMMGSGWGEVIVFMRNGVLDNSKFIRNGNSKANIIYFESTGTV